MNSINELSSERIADLSSKDYSLDSSSKTSSQIAERQLKLWEQIRQQMVTQKPDDVIHDGYGEYIITINRQPVDFATFYAVSKILQAHSPAAWAQKDLPGKDRLPELRKKVAAIDPRIQFSFVPRCLYELTLITKILQDEIDALLSVYFEDPTQPTEEELRTWKVHCVEKISPWENPDKNSVFTTIIDHAFEINTILSKKINKSDRFTRKNILELAEESINFIKSAHSKKWIQFTLRKLDLLDPYSFSPLLKAFPESSIDGAFREFVLKVISLECCPATRGKVIFYRGSNFYRDKTRKMSSQIHPRPHSLSYGTGAFTGIMRDRGATPFCYIFDDDGDLDGYALVFSPRNAREVFFAPTEHTMMQIYGKGEFFHGRSKITNREDSKEGVSGVCGSENSSHLRTLDSKLPSETLEKTFQAYKGAAIFLRCLGN